VAPQQELRDLERLLAGFPGKDSRGFYREPQRPLLTRGAALKRYRNSQPSSSRSSQAMEDFLRADRAYVFGNRFCDTPNYGRSARTMRGNVVLQRMTPIST
jgi:hypothetical protein